MSKEQEDYIKLEEAAKEWINKTDDSQFETYELLAMFASGENNFLISPPVAANCYRLNEVEDAKLKEIGSNIVRISGASGIGMNVYCLKDDKWIDITDYNCW